MTGELVAARQRVDQGAVDRRRRASSHDQPALRILLAKCHDIALDLLGILEIDGAQLDTQPLRRRLDRAELTGTGRDKRFPKHSRTRHIGRDLLQQLEPFAADGIFKVGEACDIAARARQVGDVACANRICDQRENDRDCPARLQQRRDGRARMGQDDVGHERDQLLRVLAHGVGAARAPAIIDADVLADGPTRLLETLRKRCEAGLRFRIICRKPHQHADPPHALTLLRTRGQRPLRRKPARCRAAAAQDDELAPSHTDPPTGSHSWCANMSVICVAWGPVLVQTSGRIFRGVSA